MWTNLKHSTKFKLIQHVRFEFISNNLTSFGPNASLPYRYILKPKTMHSGMKSNANMSMRFSVELLCNRKMALAKHYWSQAWLTAGLNLWAGYETEPWLLQETEGVCAFCNNNDSSPSALQKKSCIVKSAAFALIPVIFKQLSLIWSKHFNLGVITPSHTTISSVMQNIWWQLNQIYISLHVSKVYFIVPKRTFVLDFTVTASQTYISHT